MIRVMNESESLRGRDSLGVGLCQCQCELLRSSGQMGCRSCKDSDFHGGMCQVTFFLSMENALSHGHAAGMNGRLGTISTKTSKLHDALSALTRVVQLEPEEHEAWANVAAVHMRNKNPAETYTALQEVCHCEAFAGKTSCTCFQNKMHSLFPCSWQSLKHFRCNWRVWTSKLYACLD
jgi:hypothetical protein